MLYFLRIVAITGKTISIVTVLLLTIFSTKYFEILPEKSGTFIILFGWAGIFPLRTRVLRVYTVGVLLVF
jgi:hypothetical protein